ncbi:class F sortase [Ornithinimicrobium avium]|uniref:Class F sortase n=1 Tax=Ornithinimicrobium avium TaxID=2283195 RepID=A0A345NPG4_9MICO|nr:class F sortase [Ornithinimicrobium avium]AXH96922.1 class F sortase [Ornithinimicrobium avium]
MGRGSAHRPTRRSRRLAPGGLLALGALLACLLVVGWAVRGLLVDGAEAGADASSSLLMASSAATTLPPPGSAPDPAAGPSAASAPAPRSSVGQPGRSSAALADAGRRSPRGDRLAAPAVLRVPSLRLEVALDAVGVSDDGQMEIPEQADRAGWYRYGPAPGSDAGSVVLAGHVDTTTGPGAFAHLTRVAEGAEIVIELADGTRTAYRVVGGQTVAKTDLAVDELFRRDGDPVLRLVTCTGDWSPRTGHYVDNHVVTAVPVG